MDGFLSPIDALMVISSLNSGSSGPGEGEAEGEFSVSPAGTTDLLAATTPPAGEVDLGGAVLLSSGTATTAVTASPSTSSTRLPLATDTSSASQSTAPSAIPIGIEELDSEHLREWATSIGVEEALDTLPLNGSLDDLAALISADRSSAVDEIFRQMGDA